MESVLKLIQRTESAAEEVDADQEKLVAEIKDVARLLAYNECWFQLECDSDLIDACIYQREELQARYRYLLSRVKRYSTNAAV